MGNGDDIEVRPEDLKRAGEHATAIGDQAVGRGGEVQASAKIVWGAMSGSALAEAHDDCAREWAKELDALGRNILEAGRGLRDNANNYEKADALGKKGFDSIGSMLGD